MAFVVVLTAVVAVLLVLVVVLALELVLAFVYVLALVAVLDLVARHRSRYRLIVNITISLIMYNELVFICMPYLYS